MHRLSPAANRSHFHDLGAQRARPNDPDELLFLAVALEQARQRLTRVADESAELRVATTPRSGGCISAARPGSLTGCLRR